MFNEELPELPPVLQETMDSIDSMSKKDLKEFSKRILLNLVSAMERNEDLQRRYNAQYNDYMSRCSSSGGVTLPPNFK